MTTRLIRAAAKCDEKKAGFFEWLSDAAGRISRALNEFDHVRKGSTGEGRLVHSYATC